MQRILVADDHPLFLDGLVTLLTSIFPSTSIHSANDIQQVQAELEKTPISLLLLDRVMPGMDGMKRVPELRAQYPDLIICIMSASDSSQHIREALDHGAAGYIPKVYAPEKTLAAINKILSGGLFIPEEAWVASPKKNTSVNLSPRQIEIIQTMSQGKSNKIIAHELNITEGTVKQHASNIFKLLKASNRTLAIQRARDLGLLS